MLAQRISPFALGFEDLNDQQTIRIELALHLADGVCRRNGFASAALSRANLLKSIEDVTAAGLL